MDMNKPIGVFDSGIGGLTVAKAIKKSMPNEQIVYFGDTKHLPYGDKSKETLVAYSLEITRFMLKQGVKAIVVACNSASAMAYKEINEIAGDIPVYNVIDPIVDYISSLNGLANHVGLIATKATVNSNVYYSKISKKKISIRTSSLATPLLVPMIEEGFHDDKISNTIIQNYLCDKHLKGIDTLILGCTHYPLIEDEINEFYKGQVNVLNSANIVADKVKNLLKNSGLNSKTEFSTRDKFFVSDYTESFEKTAKIIFGSDIHLEKVILENK
ncbi:MAG: glutamate racemase [Flavobacteriales bacterium]|nr:glutamate racemase [Flavobacteriales bacterium]